MDQLGANRQQTELGSCTSERQQMIACASVFHFGLPLMRNLNALDHCGPLGSQMRHHLELRVGGWGAVSLHVDEPGGWGPFSHAQSIPQILRQDSRLGILDLHTHTHFHDHLQKRGISCSAEQHTNCCRDTGRQNSDRQTSRQWTSW